MIKYPVAHIRQKGVDLVIVLLDTSFGKMSPTAKAEILRMLQQNAQAAGLRGAVVPIWDRGDGRAEFLADRQLIPIIQNLTLQTVHANINRELIIKSGIPAAAMNDKAAVATPVSRAQGGVVSVVAEIADCAVQIDGSFVGNIPAKVRLKDGKHVVEVKKDGFKTYRQEIEITDGSEILLRPVMEKTDPLMTPFSENVNLQGAMDQRGKLGESQRKHRVGMVTLLFSDLVGSTKLKQDLGDHDAVAIMQRHHSIVRDILGRFPTGEEISTAGDSFFLAFAKPSDAVKFSLLLQAKLRELNKGSRTPILDRIGIHVGEVFIEENQGPGKPKDMYGIQVDTCARVMSLGDGDQILMTRFAYDNARQVLKNQQVEGVGPLAWLTHGEYDMKGVEDPLEICEVGEVGRAVLKAPGNSEKAQKHNSGEQVEAPAEQPHVVVSTRSSAPISPFRRQG
ncbi:MAG: PEGA domain-containing protein [Verrucomicrobia bacterium]|nr:PEGA domain-containing protein [Verrucomicrobiota bacterium]